MPSLIQQSVQLAAESFGVAPRAILRTRSRSEPLATARKVAMVLAYRSLGNARRVGRAFHRGHTTVLYAVKHTRAEHLEAAQHHQPVHLPMLTPARQRQRKHKHQHRHQHQLRQIVKTGRCLCGNPATRRDPHQKSWVCDRCHAIEARLYHDVITRQ